MNPTPRDLLVIRHGINSNSGSMQYLADRLKEVEPGEPEPEVDNVDYPWKAPVMENGLELARRIVSLYKPEAHRRVVMIGHSQGGLLCRVAAVALAGRRRGTAGNAGGFGRAMFDASAFGAEMAQLIGGWSADDRENAARTGPALCGVVMLATPNAGALTFGQLSMLGRVTAAVVRRLTPSFGIRDLPDLTTDRLSSILQHYSVPSIKYLSISGSAINRYSVANHDDLVEVPVVGRLGVHLERPNDMIVEDSSVDLGEAPLPSEIEDIDAQYEHIRAYIDCTSVSHTGIQENFEVIRLVRSRLRRWRREAGAAA
jgi:pimeloyl-ACP methyl ester carboxylesterase